MVHPGQPVSRRRLDSVELGLLASLAAIVGFVAFIYAGIPLLPKQTDSGWYHMGAWYLRTGEYVWESMYPSFEGPSQYYPLGGYSLAIVAAQKIGEAIGSDWVIVLRVMQFTAYVLTGVFTYAIGVRLKGRKTGLAAALLYFASFPFLNYADLVMSENLASLLISAFTFLFLEALARDRRVLMYASFLLAGYAVLLKTVLLALLPLLLIATGIYQWKDPRRAHWAVLLAALTACPAGQSLLNRFIFGNYRIVGGLGLHLCDRILLAGKSISVDLPGPFHPGGPEYVPIELALATGSPAVRRLAEELQQRAPRYVAIHPRLVTLQLYSLGYSPQQIERIRRSVTTSVLPGSKANYVPIEAAMAATSSAFRTLANELRKRRLRYMAFGAWWHLASQLSPLGYSKEQVEEACWDLSWDGLLENKWDYVAGTLVMTAKLFFEEKELYPTGVFPTYDESFAWVAVFHDEPMYRPLTEALLRQKGSFGSGTGGLPPRLYRGFSDVFTKAQELGLQSVIASGFLLWALMVIVATFRQPRRGRIPSLVVAAIPVIVILGSCATEVQEARYRLPVQPLLIVGCCLFFAELPSLAALARSGRPRTPATRVG